MKFQNMEAGYKVELKRAEEEHAKLGDVNKELITEVIFCVPLFRSWCDVLSRRGRDDSPITSAR